MSRARNIKPGFFANELLAECHPLARILFAGLWCESDRSGILEDRPKRIKVNCLPYDDCDCDELLGQLEDRGFIARYRIADIGYIQVLAFSKHQNPHIREAASTMPTYAEHCASTVPAENRSGSATLIPDSGFLIPDSSKETCAPPNGGSPIHTEKPSAEKSPKAGRSMTFDQWMESLGDEEAIPSDHSSFAYARDAGIPYDWLHLAWVAFERRYTGDKKRYTDWRRVFRNAVEGNWMKIWWVKDGQYFLGTVGQQVMNIRTTAESSQAKPA